MPKELELREGEEAAERFRRMAKKVVNVPKSEIDRRSKEWREAKDAEKSETASE
jgi:hypothetical protein